MASLSGTYIAYKTIQLLTRDWEDWDAYKLGIINDKGETIKSPSSSEEKAAFTMFHIMVKNLKKLLEKIPFGKTKLASYTAGLWLIREQSESPFEFDKCMMEYFDITYKDILLNESVAITIKRGIYQVDGTFVIVKEDLEPFTTYLGIPLYKTVYEGTEFVFSAQSIEKYKYNSNSQIKE